MGQLIVRLNTALTSGSWTDEYGNVWTVRNTLKAAEDPERTYQLFIFVFWEYIF